jgi:hypothetical protein
MPNRCAVAIERIGIKEKRAAETQAFWTRHLSGAASSHHSCLSTFHSIRNQEKQNPSGALPDGNRSKGIVLKT